jgi:predicted transcriptional regulator of viral defense system
MSYIVAENPVAPDDTLLFEIASEQQGYFTAAQAGTCGFSWALLSYFASTGRFIRIRRGLYRLRDYPTSPREEVMAAWLAAGKEVAVVSHESALDLLDLSDVIPDTIHLTVPRNRSNAVALPGVTLHTAIHPPGAGDTMVREGMRVTAPLRTILDAAQSGTQPDQIERAVVEAVLRGLVLPQRLRAAAEARGRRVAAQIARALDQASLVAQ